MKSSMQHMPSSLLWARQFQIARRLHNEFISGGGGEHISLTRVYFLQADIDPVAPQIFVGGATD